MHAAGKRGVGGEVRDQLCAGDRVGLNCMDAAGQVGGIERGGSDPGADVDRVGLLAREAAQRTEGVRLSASGREPVSVRPPFRRRPGAEDDVVHAHDLLDQTVLPCLLAGKVLA